VLRTLAVRALKPEYPSLSIQRGAKGVAVAWIEVGPKGVPEIVKILQAPDDLIAKAFKQALVRWRFRTVGVPPRYGGKLTYYFRESAGKGSVVAGDEFE
jgi:hypothetical protein